MPLSNDVLQPLEAVLRESVVRIDLVNEHGRVLGHGTGFFVNAGQVLTCHHVVKGAVTGKQTVRVVTWDAATLAVTSMTSHGPGWPDLALLEVAGADDRPCVLLDESPIARDVPLLAAGFPEGTEVDYQTPGMLADGQSTNAEGKPFQKVRDVQIEHGLSGGPVVEREGGFVCGVTRLTKGAGGTLGGFVIPASTVLETFPELRAVHDCPGPVAKRWVDVLGAEHLARFNRERDGRREVIAPPVNAPRIDLLVQGAQGTDLPRCWSVTIGFPPDSGVAPHDVRLADLGDDLMEALDRWSRRRPLEGEDEVEVLGRVLHRAILPPPIAGYVRERAAQSDGLLLRLLVSPGRLSEIPWEYARPEGGPPLATDATVRFSRYIAVEADMPAAKDRLTVLLAVVCPPWIHSRLGYGRDVPPDAGALCDQLERLILDGSGGRIDVRRLVNPDVTAFKEALQDVEVVHYLGYGRTRPGSPAGSSDGELAFCNASGKADWVRPRQLGESARRRLAAMVVQLQVPPAGDREAPLPGGSLLPLLDRTVAAVVSNSHPAPLEHVSEFTSYFYKRLALGLPLEDAVQTARTHLRDQNPLGDPTAFGMFSITTCRSSGLALLVPPGGDTISTEVQPPLNVRAESPSSRSHASRTVDTISRPA